MGYELFLYNPAKGYRSVRTLATVDDDARREEANEYLRSPTGIELARNYTDVVFMSGKNKSSTFKIRANEEKKQTAWFEIRKDGEELK